MSVIEALVCPECGEKKYIELDNGDYKCSCCNLLFFKVELSEQHKLNRAQLDLSIYKFEDANNIYAELLKETKDEKTKVMCYYGMLLAYFGVKYIKDSKDRLIVTFNKYYYYSNINSIKDTDYYKKIKNSSYYECYQEKLDKLDEEYKHIKEELDKKSEYDVFICVKVTESETRHTEDSIEASKIYNSLTKRGLKVFYSEENLSGKVKYDAQIYSALMRSDNILVISSSKEYLESNWVKSEWKRWLNFIEAKKKKDNSFYLYLLNKKVQVPAELQDIHAIYNSIDVIDKLIENCKDNKQESIDELLKKAEKYFMLTEYDEAVKMYRDICIKYDDYRPWLGLIDILIETEVKMGDKRYINYYNKAISLCKDNTIKEKLKSKYQKYTVTNVSDNKTIEQSKPLDTTNVINKEILDPKEQNQLGEDYYYGKNGKTQDYNKAVYWYEKSANQGYDFAQYSLGYCYQHGQGVSKDYTKAVYWYEKAANQGNTSAKKALDKLRNVTDIIQRTNIPINRKQVKLDKSYKIGDVLTLGKYPQTLVSNSSLINALNNISKTNSLGYIEYNGEEYKKEGSNYYKVEPIKWKVLESNNGTYKLLSDMLLDCQEFYKKWDENRTINGKTIYPNNYEYSHVRAWLNGYDGSSYSVNNYTNKGFIDIAFTAEERKLINTTLVDNSLSSTCDSKNSYICNNTNDKIYLISHKEATNTSYGFTNSTSTTTTREAKATDYAKAKGCYVNKYNGNSSWWLRSPTSYYSSYARSVNNSGSIGSYYVNDSRYGVRAALEITI